jgi:hypothetical protein
VNCQLPVVRFVDRLDWSFVLIPPESTDEIFFLAWSETAANRQPQNTRQRDREIEIVQAERGCQLPKSHFDSLPIFLWQQSGLLEDSSPARRMVN